MDGAKAWTRYWTSGQTDSCFTAGAAYDGAALWNAFFDDAEPAARILDLACGGGALTRLAVKHSGGFQVTGVDYAQTLPEVPGATLLAGVALEALPLETGAFDRVVSQFGLEYAQRDQAVAELVRVLAPKGRVGLLMHHADGEVARTMKAARARLQPLLGESSVVARVIALGESAEAGRSRPDLEAAIREDFSVASKVQHDQTTSWAYSFLSEILNKRTLFAPSYLHQNARLVRDELEAAATRLDDMVAAASTEADMCDYMKAFENNGIKSLSLTGVTDHQGAVFAWNLLATA